MSKKIKRRDLLKTGLKVTATASLSHNLNLKKIASAQEDLRVESNEYDFIVVGSGAGGGPLAANLANAGHTVLLIEAGGKEVPLSARVPAFHPLSSEDGKISWDFFVQHRNGTNDLHEKWRRTDKGEGILYPRSSVVGGCTVHNAMICLYPDSDDWKRIGELTGKKDSWNPNDMYKLFQEKFEHYKYANDSTSGWHNLELSPVSLLLKDRALLNIALGAAKSEGLNVKNLMKNLTNDPKQFVDQEIPRGLGLDPNSPENIDKTGFFRIPKSTKNGNRFSVYDRLCEEESQPLSLANFARNTILQCQSKRKNLKIQTDTLVKKVILDREDNGELRAIGVEVAIGKNLYGAHKYSSTAITREEKIFKARKEVILAGGAFNTPQILMLSGIGPKEHLEEMGIEVKKPLNGVGKNLQDRYEVTVVSKLKENLEILKGCKFNASGDEDTVNVKSDKYDSCLVDWLNESQRKDSLYSTNGAVAAIRMKSSKSQPGKNDLIVFGVPGDFRGYYPGYSADSIKPDHFTWAILKGHSRNRMGEVKLNSDSKSNPDAYKIPPKIHFHYFEGDGGEEDLQAVYEGVNKVNELNLHHLKWRTDVLEGQLYPSKDDMKDKKSVKDWIKKSAWGHHASCTNKMGKDIIRPEDDPSDNSVVNSDFKVHGTSNLRIVDASVFPEIPGLFIVAPIYIISEKASQIILKQNKKV